MLSVEGVNDHPQPMSPFPDRSTGQVWFISKTDTELVRGLQSPRTAQFVLVAQSPRLYASMRGTVAQVHDRARLEELWSPVVAAWFEQGIDDPTIALLRLNIDEAAIWTADDGALSFGWEILKANIASGQKPDLGSFDVIHFAA